MESYTVIENYIVWFQYNMELKQAIADSLQAYLQTPADQRTVTPLATAFWPPVMDAIARTIVEKHDLSSFLEDNYELINFGYADELFPNKEHIRKRVENKPDSYKHLELFFLSSWIAHTYTTIYDVSKRELLEQEIRKNKNAKNKIIQEMELQQSTRKDLLIHELNASLDKALVTQIESLANTDKLELQNLRIKKLLSKGLFLTVEQRRDFAQASLQLQKQLARIVNLYARVRLSESKKNLQSCNNHIHELMEQYVDKEAQIRLQEEELRKISEQNQALTPREIENLVRTELEHVRDLTKLCARRIHLETCSFVRPEDPVFTIKDLCACFDRIIEFDPFIFNNDRAKNIGKPKVLIVPGNGNSLYDWKNNLFIVPLIPQGSDFIRSIAHGVIEYRLDVDEEKKLLNSYHQLPETKTIKSMVNLRSNLVKDYIKWMTSSASGFKVMSKELQNWFEHEIAPKKNQIYCPLEFQSFNLNKEQWTSLHKDVVNRLQEKNDSPLASDLWILSLLACQEGNLSVAYQCLSKLCAMGNGNKENRENKYSYYNLGIVCMQSDRKQEAIVAFKVFLSLDTHSWWSSVVTEYLRKMQ